MSENKKKQSHSSHASLETQILKISATSKARVWDRAEKRIGGKPAKKTVLDELHPFL